MLRPEIILTPLINSLNGFQNDFLLALDDYHVIDTPAIQTALAFLLDHLPPRMHLVLLTRADPPLPLSRLRGRGHLTEIRAEHLRFNLDESAQFLNSVMGLDLTADQVAALEKRTEGWVAGLQMAALSMQGREDVDGFVSAFTGSNHYIVDYLGEEVLVRQPGQLQQFLLKTSILERFTGSLCDAITGGQDGNEILEGLEHANLFVIPLDKDQCWYRYHHLFADLLRSRLSHSQPEIASQLHVRASIWFEENGFLDEAISHALDALDYERAARLFCMDQMQVIYSRNISTLERWLKAFPEPFLLSDPRLCMAKAHVLWANGRRDQFEPYVVGAQEALSKEVATGHGSGVEPDTAILQGEIYTFQSLAAMNHAELPLAVDLARKAVQVIPGDVRSHVFALGSLYMAYGAFGDIGLAAETSARAVAVARLLNYPSMHSTAAYTLAVMLRAQGRLHSAEKMLRESIAYVERQGQSRLFYNGVLHIGLAETLYEWNALDEMESELETGLALCRQGGMNILVPLGLFARVLLKQARGDLQGASAALLDIEQECKDMDPAVYQGDCADYRLRWQAEQGNLAGLEERLGRIDLQVGQKVGLNRFSQLYLAAQLLIYLGRFDDSLEILEHLETALGGAGIAGSQVFVLSLQAVAWANKKAETRALDCLRRAFVLAEPEGYVRVFLNRGKPMQELLQHARRQDLSPDFVTRILTAFAAPPSGKAAAHLPARPALLSKREVELLGLIVAGCSNKEIASQLVISLGTVKRHTVNIFNKLDVKNRTEAVARARELELF